MELDPKLSAIRTSCKTMFQSRAPWSQVILTGCVSKRKKVPKIGRRGVASREGGRDRAVFFLLQQDQPLSKAMAIRTESSF